MIIADTSIWIEFLKGNESIFDKMKELLETRKILGLSVIFGELLQGSKNKNEKSIIYNYWKYIPKYNEENIFIEAGLYSCENKLISKGVGLIDATLLVIAENTNSQIWSLDKKLNNIIPVELLFK
jgi:predicted nucleic acid-binding protein